MAVNKDDFNILWPENLLHRSLHASKHALKNQKKIQYILPYLVHQTLQPDIIAFIPFVSDF